MFGITPLLPAYGRDYRSISEVAEDFYAGKDFLTSMGKYISRGDLERLGLAEVEIRFKNKRSSCLLPVDENPCNVGRVPHMRSISNGDTHMNKHFFIDPAGDEHTRNSKTRTYTHAVIGKRSYDMDVRGASIGWESTDHSNFKFYTVGNGQEDRSDDGVKARMLNNVDEYMEYKLADRLRKIEDKRREGYYDQWVCLGWCGRRDLAEKQLNQWPGYSEKRIVEAQLK
jgi:hypothetical protein